MSGSQSSVHGQLSAVERVPHRHTLWAEVTSQPAGSLHFGPIPSWRNCRLGQQGGVGVRSQAEGCLQVQVLDWDGYRWQSGQDIVAEWGDLYPGEEGACYVPTGSPGEGEQTLGKWDGR